MGKKPDHYLREWRERAGLSQDEAAEKSGLAQPVIQRIETGVRDYRAKHLNALAPIYGCAPWELIGRDPRIEDGDAEVIKIWDHIAARDKKRALMILRTLASDL